MAREIGSQGRVFVVSNPHTFGHRQPLIVARMKNIIFLSILTCLLCACTTPHGQLAKITMENRENLFQLKIGMDKEEVLEIMGQSRKTIRDLIGNIKGYVNNPYKREFLTIDDKQYEVIYYYTDIKAQRPPGPPGFYKMSITDDELTPLVFEGGKLIGWGWSFLKVKIPTYEIRVR